LFYGCQHLLNNLRTFKIYQPGLETGLLANRSIANVLWFGLSVIAAVQAIRWHDVNNFLIFRSVYFHLVQGQNLYLFYPGEYRDVNLYGPVFGLLIAPFALLPLTVGIIAWVISNTIFLYWAITRLPFTRFYKTVLIFLCSHELMNNSSWLQTNALVCGCLLLGFCYTRKKQEIWALFFILLAAFIKIYGVIGLVFLLFSDRPSRFIQWGIIWFVIFFLLPLFFTNWHFLVQCYSDWYTGLSIKAEKNISLMNHNFFQDISVPGLIRRNFWPGLRDIYVLLPAILIFFSQFAYYRLYKNSFYQLYLLCSALIFVVIFSTGSESPTYIIAVPGMIIWFFLQPANKFTGWFFAIALLFTTFCYSDLMSPAFREFVVMPRSLKAFFPFVIWAIIVYQIHKNGLSRLASSWLCVEKLPILESAAKS
jgi:Glycosyltransferase family 87